MTLYCLFIKSSYYSLFICIYSLPNCFIKNYKSYFIIDFKCFFIYIIDKKKINQISLKKDKYIYFEYILYYIKIINNNKSFILILIMVVYWYYIKVKIRVSII